MEGGPIGWEVFLARDTGPGAQGWVGGKICPRALTLGFNLKYKGMAQGILYLWEPLIVKATLLGGYAVLGQARHIGQPYSVHRQKIFCRKLFSLDSLARAQ